MQRDRIHHTIHTIHTTHATHATPRHHRIVAVVLLLCGVLLLAGGCGEPRAPQGAMKVSELAANPLYETQVRLFGQVEYLGEVDCDCFDLTSGDMRLKVWYDSMVEDDGTPQPAVSTEGIENGDWVIVTGALKSESENRPRDAFWATSIEKVR
jgi:hypothetical protein